MVTNDESVVDRYLRLREELPRKRKSREEKKQAKKEWRRFVATQALANAIGTLLAAGIVLLIGAVTGVLDDWSGAQTIAIAGAVAGFLIGIAVPIWASRDTYPEDWELHFAREAALEHLGEQRLRELTKERQERGDSRADASSAETSA